MPLFSFLASNCASNAQHTRLAGNAGKQLQWCCAIISTIKGISDVAICSLATACSFPCYTQLDKCWYVFAMTFCSIIRLACKACYTSAFLLLPAAAPSSPMTCITHTAALLSCTCCLQFLELYNHAAQDHINMLKSCPCGNWGYCCLHQYL